MRIHVQSLLKFTLHLDNAFLPISEAPTLSFAKNLFPFNGSSLFTSAN